MVATKITACTFVVVLFLISSTKAQQCGNCNLKPSIALYDFDVQVAKPTDPLQETAWTLLYGLSWHANNHIIKSNGQCVNFIEPFSKNPQGVETIQISATAMNLPVSGNVAGDYYITGTVTQGDLDNILEIRLHASCSGKVIESSEVRFAKGSDQPAVINAAKLAAGKFLDLHQLIQQLELKERKESPQTDISANNSKPIAIRLSRNTLKAGEKTDITVEVTDCDGKPLADREVLFTAATFEGMKIPGTIGGTVIPWKTVTDANGRASATFTLQGGSSEAIIAVHSPGKDVKGCGSILFGDAPVNIKYTHSGYVTYTYIGSSGLTSDKSDKTMNYFYTGDEKTTITYRASFYGEGEAGGISLTSAEEEAVGTDIPDMLEFGNYNYAKSDYWKNTLICNCAGKGEVTEQRIKNTGAGEIKNSTLHFSYSEGAGRLSLNLKFTSKNSAFFKASHLPEQTSNSEDDLHWPVDFDTFMDKNFKIIKEKVGNKIKYTGRGTNYQSESAESIGKS
jgi:hypothetical protein